MPSLDFDQIREDLRKMQWKRYRIRYPFWQVAFINEEASSRFGFRRRVRVYRNLKVQERLKVKFPVYSLLQNDKLVGYSASLLLKCVKFHVTQRGASATGYVCPGGLAGILHNQESLSFAVNLDPQEEHFLTEKCYSQGRAPIKGAEVALFNALGISVNRPEYVDPNQPKCW